MIFLSKKVLIGSQVVGLGLLAVFVVAVLGCGSGLVSSPAMQHSGMNACTNMFVDTFVISQKEGGIALSLVLFFIVNLLVLTTLWLPLNLREAFRGLVGKFIIEVSKTIAKLHDIILRAFSAGILRSKIY
jgi:hypothetical protein